MIHDAVHNRQRRGVGGLHDHGRDIIHARRPVRVWPATAAGVAALLKARTGVSRTPTYGWDFQDADTGAVEKFAGVENFAEGGTPVPAYRQPTPHAGRRGILLAAAGDNHLLRSSANLRAGAGESLLWHLALEFAVVPSIGDYILANSSTSHLNLYIVDGGGGEKHVRLSVKSGASSHTITAALDVSGKEIDIAYGVTWATDTSFLSVHDGATIATVTGDVTGYGAPEVSSTYIGSLSTLGAAGFTIFGATRWLSTAAEGTDGSDICVGMRGGTV